MAMYEFHCGACGLTFEKVVRGEIPTHQPCSSCGGSAARKLTDFGFEFGDGKTPGNTGVYALDTDVDRAVGRDSTKSWEHYKDRFNRKRQVQRENGGEGKVPLTFTGQDYEPMSAEAVQRFRSMHKDYSESLTAHRKRREAAESSDAED
jgi:putative FmdB family regulatory protein